MKSIGVLALASVLGLLPATGASGAGYSGNEIGASASSGITVTLEVRSSVGVTLRGEPSISDNLIQLGDPASGKVSYVILDD